MEAAPVLIVLIAAAAAGFFLRRWLLIRQIPSASPARHLSETVSGESALDQAQGRAEEASSPGSQGEPTPERRAEPDPQALEATAAEVSRVGFDLDRIKTLSSDYRPVEEFLRYIQVQRGEGASSLVFVRRRDLESMGALMGMSREGFVDESEKLGVIISLN